MSPGTTDIVPDYMSARVGYRTWLVTLVNRRGDYDLRSLNGVCWPAKMKMQAACLRRFPDGFRDHDAPMPSCTCGIYATKSRVSDHFNLYIDTAPVWGEVYLWGKIQEHIDGYRAEFAYPKNLITRFAGLAPKIAERYGVPCAIKADV